MARRRYQRGSVRLRGKKQVWIGQYREDIINSHGETERIRRTVVLGVRSSTFTKPIALRALEARLAKINAHAYRPQRMATVEEFVERYRTEVLEKRKPSSVRSANSHFRSHILPKLGKLPLDALGVENQQRFVNMLKGVSRKTVLNVLSTLSGMLTTAKNWGYACEPVELKKLAMPEREVRVTPRFFTAQQVKLILQLAAEPYATMFAVLAMTGMRAGEALGLQAGDIDFLHQTITIRRSAWYGRIQTPKTSGSAAVIPLPRTLAEILSKHASTMPAERFLFTTRNNRPPSSNYVVTKYLWPILDGLKIPRCGLHAFRHSVASLLSDAGVPLNVAQAQLRHSDARTTLGYTHLIGDPRVEAMNKVAERLAPNGVNSEIPTKLLQ